MPSPEYQLWRENEQERMTRSQSWRPNIGTVVLVALAAVAICVLVTM